LAIKESAKRVLRSTRLISGMDAPHSPVAVARGPFTVLVGDMPALNLDHRDATRGREQHEIDLHVTGLTIAESEAVDEYFPVAQ
jgi:hypothetical protein